MKARWLHLGLFLFSLFIGSAAESQVTGQLAWRVLDPSAVKAKFIRTDVLGHIYVIEETAAFKSFLNIYDKFGTLITTYSINGVVDSLDVDSYTGTAVASSGNTIAAFYWNGEGFFSASIGTLLAAGMDESARVLMVYVQSGETDVRSSTGQFFGLWKTSAIATSASIDDRGRVLLVGFVNGQSGPIFVNFYAEDGTMLWSRSYPSASKDAIRVAGFVEDQDGIGYLMMNRSNLVTGQHIGWVECIDPATGSSDKWQSANFTGSLTFCAADSSGVFVAGSSSVPYLSALNTNSGLVSWSRTQRVDGMTTALFGPVIEAYDTKSHVVRIISYGASDGKVLSSIAATAPTVSDMGPINGETRDVEYAGSTGGTAPTALFAKIAYGQSLVSLVLPSAALGGTTLNATINLTQPSQVPGSIEWISSNSHAIPAPDPVGVSLASTPVQFPTLPVDLDTTVILTAEQSTHGIRRPAKVTVKTASESALSFAASTLGPNKTTLATLSLNGMAGPSGKLVAVSSNSGAATAPPKLSIAANKTTGAFTVTTHPVTTTTLVTISATCQGHTVSQTLTVTK